MKNKIIHRLRGNTFALYAVIGVSGVTIDFIIYLMLINFGIPAIFASIVSVSAGIVNNFILNAKYNFKRTDHLLYRFLSFYAVGLVGVVLSVLFIFTIHDIFGFDPVIAKLISIPFIVIFQYWFNKNASFALDHKQIPWLQMGIFTICILTVIGFMFNAPYYDFTDEADNLLGGQFISQGGIMYKEYFSHHMPLPYFVSAFFFTLLGTKLIAVKVAFGIAMSGWLLAMARHLLKHFGLLTFALFCLIITATQTLNWSHMILGETFVAFAIAHALILFSIRYKLSDFKFTDSIVFSLLAAIIVLSSLSYAPLSILVYIMLITLIIKTTDIKRLNVKKVVTQALAHSSIIISPYIIFGFYLLATRTFGEFKFQAVSFNTLYYSKFIDDAPMSKLDTVFSISQGITQNLFAVLTFNQSVVVNPVLAFLMCISIIAGITIMKRYRMLVPAVFIIGVFLLGSSRGGLSVFLSGTDTARSGMVTTFAGFLLLAISLGAISWSRDKKFLERSYQKMFFYLSCTIVALVFLLSFNNISTIGRYYLRGSATVDSRLQSGSPATVINTVSSTNNYYWVGPIDFSSQLKINAQPASMHRFFAPWHGACTQCRNELINDLVKNKPSVIAVDTDLEILNNPPISQYFPELKNLTKSQYYQLKDPALKYFYFKNSEMIRIDSALKKKGYDVEHK